MNVYGFHCKTPRCGPFLVVREMADDTARGIQVPINRGPRPTKASMPRLQTSTRLLFF